MAEPGRLVGLSGDVRPAEVCLESERCEIGRSSLRNVVIARDIVSRLHAVIERRAERYWLLDAGSTNGSFINGERITGPVLLKDGDQIGLGDPAPLLRFVDETVTMHRGQPAPSGPRLQFDPAGLSFAVNGRPLPLPPTQLRLLHHLLSHAGAVCSRESCAQAAWGRAYDPALDRDALDKIVSKLRQRLAQADPGLKGAIQSRRGVGYVLMV